MELDARKVLRARLWAVVSLVILVPIGLGTKRYDGPLADLVVGNVGGALYVTFFCLVGAALWPRARSWLVGLIVLGGTCCIELLQLWHPPWLEAIRSTRVGGLLLGSTFSWGDFPLYVLGAALGVGWLTVLSRTLSQGTGRPPGRGSGGSASQPPS